MLKLTLVLVNSLGELVDGGWNLETLEKNTLLSLDADILWPLDEAGEVASWLNITTDSEVSWGLLEKGALFVSTGRSTTNDGFLSLSSFLYRISNHR